MESKWQEIEMKPQLCNRRCQYNQTNHNHNLHPNPNPNKPKPNVIHRVAKSTRD